MFVQFVWGGPGMYIWMCQSKREISRECREQKYSFTTGTCFIQKIYAPSSSFLQGKHLPFSPSPFRLNVFRWFVILSLTQLYRYTPEIFLFSTDTFKYTYQAPLRRIGQTYLANVASWKFKSLKRILFAYLWSFRWSNYIVTLPRYFSFRLPHLNIPTGPPSDELDKNIQRKSLRLFFNHWNGYSHIRSCLNHWNGYSHFRFALDFSYAFGIL
jgi:hypothetical protein